MTPVVFDLGQVLATAPDRTTDLASLLLGPAATAAEKEAVERAYWTDRVPFDDGGPSAAYWAGVLDTLGRELGRTLAADPEELDEIDARSWASLEPEPARLVERLGVAGIRLALLSNSPAPLAAAVRTSTWSEPFEALVFSCEIRCSKPAAGAYAAVEEALGVSGPVFFDDRP
jgi:putative hydrolase of the HAD superfamily